MAAHGGGWQGRRERSWPLATGATEDAARRRRVRPSGCEIYGWWGSLGNLDDLGETPALGLRQRARLDDPDDVADVRTVLLVVRVELDRAADHLLVLLVRADRVDLDDDRLVHRVGHDDAAALLAPAAIVLGLLLAGDRLALGRRRALTAPLLGAKRARQPLVLLLRLRLWRRSRGLLRRSGLRGRGRFRLRRRLLRSGGLLSGSLVDHRRLCCLRLGLARRLCPPSLFGWLFRLFFVSHLHLSVLAPVASPSLSTFNMPP